MEQFTEEQINVQLQELDGWKLSDEKWITKKYRFSYYLDGIDFVTQIAKLSEEVQHHPLISIDFKLVTVKLSSWQANGLTEVDFKLASEYDRIHDQ
ncbi:4a-hydroxytetrahydrobiopterin dehydratase [Pseudalkalibacillus salsuginis]|uniref:4a-hydroxytetrahydrobiopterin dehydratase n=1 Tax=Pseudalkalibacillus salsuginis TaxID=2910972 RepID=UPI001F2CF256|nr:4a-hydroxytetrahydrobiopterin dehydratase [Pseudalkalibacillus salsuginis]MCF6409267.1 4a-hydroxytetrahydrobiopterin dehydratase [Pseudalkalibacillus salsuginis]